MNMDKIKHTLNSTKVVPYIMVLPFVLTFTIFFLYPISSAVNMSFQEVIGFGETEFVGLKNYRNLANPHYYNAVSNSLRYTLWTIAILIPLPLVMAVFLNSKQTKGSNIFRSSFFVPALTSVIVAGMFFRFAFGEQETALFNQIIGFFGASPKTWLQSKSTGMFALVVICVWRWLGVNIIYYLSGLQGISNDIYEAADIDGANGVQKFWKITVPSLKPVTTYVVTISVYGGLSMFAESFAYWSYRSPGDIGLTLVSYIYSAGFNNADFGLAATIGLTLLVLILVINIIQLTLTGFFKKEAR